MALTSHEKWNAVVHCDQSYDGVFVYGVKTTGIFCRPSCKSKEPLRTNVEFFDEIEQAHAYGLRPCKRCRPDLIVFTPIQELVEKAKHIFDTYFDDGDKLSEKIKELGASQNYVSCMFSQQFNMTPTEYINKLRVEKAMQMLCNTNLKIVDLALLCGFSSLSNFYEFFKKHVGVTPREYRKTKK